MQDLMIPATLRDQLIAMLSQPSIPDGVRQAAINALQHLPSSDEQASKKT